jgi:PhnB protein
MLTVRDATAAIDFYARAFGSTELSRVKTPTGQIVAEMSIDGLAFFVVEENPQAFNLSPESLGGTSVRMSLIVEDADASMTQAIAAGGREVFPVADQSYGLRQGRVADPSGHHWLIGTPLERG